MSTLSPVVLADTLRFSVCQGGFLEQVVIWYCIPSELSLSDWFSLETAIFIVGDSMTIHDHRSDTVVKVQDLP